MGRAKWFRSGICVGLALSMLSFAGCTEVEKAEPPSPIEGPEITISTGTTGQVGQMRIGLGDTGKEDYVDDNGKMQRHLVATLLFYIEGNPPVQKILDVHVGETVEVQNYVLYIKEISAGGFALVPGASTGHIALTVQEPSQASEPSVQP